MTPNEIKLDIAARLAGITPYITTDKILNHQMDSLPAIAIYAPSTSGQSVSETDPVFLAITNIVIDIIVSQASNYSSDLDNYVDQVKNRLFTSRSFIDQFEEIAGYDTNFEFDNQGQLPTVTAEITIQISTTEIYQVV